MSNPTIKVDHFYRVEGHGGIRVEMDGKKLLDALEAPSNTHTAAILIVLTPMPRKS